MRLECKVLMLKSEVLEDYSETRANIETDFIYFWYETDKGTIILDEQCNALFTVTTPGYDKLNKILTEAKKNEGIFFNKS